MIDFKKLLDAMIAGLGRSDQGHSPSHSANQGGPGRAHPPEGLLEKAKDLAVRHPGFTQAALLGLAGLMLGKGRKGLAGNLVKLGGLAVIGGIAYRVFQDRMAAPEASVRNLVSSADRAPPEGNVPPSPVAASTETSPFHPLSYTEDDAMLFLRAMVAAAASDGRIDEAERARIIKGLTEAGIDPQASRWLDDEMALPADVDELAESVNGPELAAQVYAAARIAIDPDTVQERDFLHRLADALDLDPVVRAQIDETADALK